MNKEERIINVSYIFTIIGMFFICIGITYIFIKFINFNDSIKYLSSSESSSLNNNLNPDVISYIEIPTYNQKTTGYRLGCEGVSLYMALRGLGYIPNYSLDDFMETMPYGKTPFDGYSGNPKIGHYGENTGKRTTIYPYPLSLWAGRFASSKNLTGASIDDLKKELSEGHVLLVFVTSGWKNPIWKYYPWSIDKRGEVENNHCLCVVGFNSKGDFLVNDCHDGRVDGRQGEYWIDGNTFAKIYNKRKYAVAVY